MLRSGRWLPAVLIAVVVLGVGGCALARPDSTPNRSGRFSYSPPTTTKHATAPTYTSHIDCDSAISYGSLRALGRAASSIAVLAPTAAKRTLSMGGVPITITRVRVLETLAGKPLATTIKLRQTGSSAVIPSGACEPLVSSGRRYLAYLAPFTLRPGGEQIDGQYVIVGGSQGLFVLRHPRVPALSGPPASSPTKPSASPSGRTVFEQAGCLACHRLGQAGNNGPGQDLTDVGLRLSATAIRHALVNPTAPMPSFRALSGPDLRALIDYLVHLRG